MTTTAIKVVSEATESARVEVGPFRIYALRSAGGWGATVFRRGGWGRDSAVLHATDPTHATVEEAVAAALAELVVLRDELLEQFPVGGAS